MWSGVVNLCLSLGMERMMKKHYEYLIGYSFHLKNGNFGFGDMCLTSEIKINTKNIPFVRNKILETANSIGAVDEEISTIAIISICLLDGGDDNNE